MSQGQVYKYRMPRKNLRGILYYSGISSSTCLIVSLY
jgi:hypothetical protein